MHYPFVLLHMHQATGVLVVCFILFRFQGGYTSVCSHTEPFAHTIEPSPFWETFCGISPKRIDSFTRRAAFRLFSISGRGERPALFCQLASRTVSHGARPWRLHLRKKK
ncbi:hypothetical protein Micbo1qcDRAFT_8169 [Microdochium bolleyi]|uniref:Uncharacterized protein n=1 Tax=Microdochium bolleyi TaxID=196109 RepID=A0A136JK09_9PEZI|nr:hypothetical protein Micbo1qcDRAFT_8169 [Microdochium bolleyi]